MDNILKEKLQPIKLLICDVDGVLTDGKLIYMTNGEEAKNFSALDGAFRALDGAFGDLSVDMRKKPPYKAVLRFQDGWPARDRSCFSWFFR